MKLFGPRDKSFVQVVEDRQSIRRFTQKNVEPEKLRKILEITNKAPSAGDLQAYDIVVVRDPDVKKALMLASLGQRFIETAPVDLVFLANEFRSGYKYGERGRKLYCVQDATIATTYAHLAADALGLGSVWVGAFNPTEIARIVSASEFQIPIAILSIGYIAEKPRRTPRRELDDLVCVVDQVGGPTRHFGKE
ncbi:malonic semialdehyde reductase RutE [Candidatus Bilamarchaeum dharawalense]|uniref:Malonic semialdehyde reductase RutE n=1 Tax=Candidatus Bilamarchaeum dharawalense TaxID=2885759 RepID=A0A5E4LT10_9ARCH|nr:malonic semialdehyde reductase RutE [Candidatus Bilamarchaeum dharawalense]